MPAALCPQTMNGVTGGRDFLQLLHGRFTQMISLLMLTAVSETRVSLGAFLNKLLLCMYCIVCMMHKVTFIGLFFIFIQILKTKMWSAQTMLIGFFLSKAMVYVILVLFSLTWHSSSILSEKLGILCHLSMLAAIFHR